MVARRHSRSSGCDGQDVMMTAPPAMTRFESWASQARKQPSGKALARKSEVREDMVWRASASLQFMSSYMHRRRRTISGMSETEASRMVTGGCMRRSLARVEGRLRAKCRCVSFAPSELCGLNHHETARGLRRLD